MKSRQQEKMLTKRFTSTIFLRSLSLTPSLSIYIDIDIDILKVFYTNRT